MYHNHIKLEGEGVGKEKKEKKKKLKKQLGDQVIFDACIEHTYSNNIQYS